MWYFVDLNIDPKDLTLDELWDLWAEEAKAAGSGPEGSVICAMKVVGQRRVLIVLNAESHDQIDRMMMAGMPMSHNFEVNEITPVRNYADFAKDVINRWK
jgi:muconolactone delta-isomerase